MEEDGGHAPQAAALLQRGQPPQDLLLGHAEALGGGRVGVGRGVIGPCVARIVAMSSSDTAIGSSSIGSAASPAAASASVPPSISRSMRILNSFSVGSWRIDSAPARSAMTSSVPCSPSRESGSTAIVNHRLKSWLRR